MIETVQPEILTPEEVAELLRVQPSFIYEKVRPRCKDPIPCRRIGRYLRFERSKVLAWFSGTDAPVPAKKRGRR